MSVSVSHSYRRLGALGANMMLYAAVCMSQPDVAPAQTRPGGATNRIGRQP